MKRLKETAAPSPATKKYKAPTGKSLGRPPQTAVPYKEKGMEVVLEHDLPTPAALVNGLVLRAAQNPSAIVQGWVSRAE